MGEINVIADCGCEYFIDASFDYVDERVDIEEVSIHKYCPIHSPVKSEDWQSKLRKVYDELGESHKRAVNSYCPTHGYSEARNLLYNSFPFLKDEVKDE